jgi:hypothetical protein
VSALAGVSRPPVVDTVQTVFADARFRGGAVDATLHLQALIDAASSAYAGLGTRQRVRVPPGKWLVSRLRWKGNVWYDFRGAVFIQNASETNSVFYCARSLKVSTYYGDHRNIKITGGTVLSNGNAAGTTVVQMCEFEDSECIDFTVVHAPGRNNWAWFVTGRNIAIHNPRVLAGEQVFQDALHIGRGYNIVVHGGVLESGDDAAVMGLDYTDAVLQADDDEGIENCSFIGTMVRARRGFGCSMYRGIDSAGVGGANRRTVRNCNMLGVVGSAGLLRNGAIRIVDQSAGLGVPGTVNSFVTGCTIQAKLTVGSTAHDGVNAFGIHVATGSKNVIEADLSFIDSTGASTRFRPFFISAVDALDLTLRQRNQVGLESYVQPYSSAHSVRGVNLKESDLEACLATNGSAIIFANALNGAMALNKVTATNFRNIPNSGYGVLAAGANTVGDLEVSQSKFFKAPGATTSFGYGANSGTSVTFLRLVDNDFSDVSQGSPGNLFAANHPAFYVAGNRGFLSRQAGTATVLAGTTSVIVNIAGAAVRFSTLTAPAQMQVNVVPTNFPPTAVRHSWALTSATTFTITVSADPGVGGATFAWALNAESKPV